MRRPARPSAGADGRALRGSLLVLLALGPLLAGAVHEVVFVPLLLGCVAVALWSAVRVRTAASGSDSASANPARLPSAPPPQATTATGIARRTRRDRARDRLTQAGREALALPGARVLLALHALVLLQLLPLPMLLLRLLSPGSHDFYDKLLLDSSGAWRPISVSPGDTLRGLAFLFCFSLLYAAVSRELREEPWRRRLLLTVVGVGVAITLVAFVQAMSKDPRSLYGVWHPPLDWAVFGPYVNRSHLAGYLLMSVPLATGFALEAFARLRAVWPSRGILALGDAGGNAAIRAAAAVMLLTAGIVAAGSRGAIGALFATALLMPLAGRRRGQALAATAVLVSFGVAWIGLGDFVQALQGRGITNSRLVLWADMLPIVPRFPLFGVGLDAFGTAYPAFQTVARVGPDWVGEAHNDYLQALFDTGILGALLFGALLVRVFRAAFVNARRGALEIGIFGALLGPAVANLVDFNWQIPATAGTWVALAALVFRGPIDRAADISLEADPPSP